MKEKDFYELQDKVEKLKDVTDGWFPTVDELKRYGEDNLKTNYIELLSYFASDPFKREQNPDYFSEKYKETVKYCKKLLYNIRLK